MRHQFGKLVADGKYREALQLYAHLHAASLKPTCFTFPFLLKAAANLPSPLSGHLLHAHLLKSGFAADTYAATALTAMYMKTHQPTSALKVFDEMPHPNLASVNATVAGLAQNRRIGEAFLVFRNLGVRIFRPNSVMIASVLSGCEIVEYGGQVHCWAVKLGFEKDVYAGTGILTMYMNCRDLDSAVEMFGVVENKNVVSYNALMSGILQNGGNCRILSVVYKEMLVSLSERPSFVTLVSLVNGCSNEADVRLGRQVHGVVVKMGLGFETKVGTSMVDMYAKCGCCHWAYRVFKEMDGGRNLITWNSMISGFMSNGESDVAVELYSRLECEGFWPDSATYNAMISGFSQLGKGTEALEFFKKMQSDGVAPTLKSVTSLLPACSAVSSLNAGKEIHGYAMRNDYVGDEFLATGLIDMYMKCGNFSLASKIFDRFEPKPSDPAFWNAMILGCGRNGRNESAFEVFDLMQRSNVQPNSATFLSILSACNHTGDVAKGLRVFGLMTRNYGLAPGPEHLGCMIGLLARSGQLDKAHELIREIPEPSATILSSFLGASEWNTQYELGENMAEKLEELETDNPAPFVMISNMYAAMGRWKDVEKIRNLMDAKRVKKLPGYSLGMI